MDSAWPRPSTSRGTVYTMDPRTLYDMSNMCCLEVHQHSVISKKILSVQREMLKPDNLVHLYKCPGRYCSYSTDAMDRAHSHWTEHNAIAENDTNSCPYCYMYTPSPYVNDLVHHIASNHGRMSFCCSRCLYRSVTGHSVESHIKRVHGVLPNHASILQAVVHENKFQDDSKIIAAKVVAKYICSHKRDSNGFVVPCGYQSAFLKPFREHLKTHPDQKHPCLYCKIPPFNIAEWVKHMKSHGFDSLVCAYCGAGCSTKARMLNHFSCLHPEKMLKVFSRQTSPLSLVDITANPFGTVRVVCRDNMDADKKDPRAEARRAYEFEKHCQDTYVKSLRK